MGFFGFFETIDDQVVAVSLLDKAFEWCKEKGFDSIMGPVNPSTNDEMGLLIDGFDSSPVMLMTYNPKHYIQKIENFGFEKEKDVYAYWIGSEVINNEKTMAKLERIAKIIRSKENITIRKLNLKDLNNEIRKIEEIYNDAWEMNWGFIPMTSDEFDYVAKSLKAIVDVDFVLFAFVGDEPVGFSLTLPDINQVLKKLNGKLFPFGIFKFISGKKKINQLRVLIMGVKHKYQKRGIDSIFYLETIKEGNKKNYKGAEISWVLEDNLAMRQTAEKLGAYIYKTYRIYSKKI